MPPTDIEAIRYAWPFVVGLPISGWLAARAAMSDPPGLPGFAAALCFPPVAAFAVSIVSGFVVSAFTGFDCTPWGVGPEYACPLDQFTGERVQWAALASALSVPQHVMLTAAVFWVATVVGMRRRRLARRAAETSAPLRIQVPEELTPAPPPPIPDAPEVVD